MEKLKNVKFSSILLFMAIASMVVVSSCNDDPPPPTPIVLGPLNEKIAEAENLISTTDEGLAEGQYPAGSQTTLQDAIDLAQVVLDNTASTQTEVDNAVIALQAAIDAYTESVIVPIDPANLVGHWQFNDGSGTTARDDSGNSFDGTFQTGHPDFGNGTPTWTTDRYGNANGAIAFNDGAWVSVPYNASLNSTQITISIWINASEINENNRFLGLQSWLGFKWQLQSANKSFFSAAVTPALTGPIFDRDTDPALPMNEWIHMAVSFGGGEMVFYIDGTESARWTDTPGDLAKITGHDLAIGVGSSKYADTPDNYDNLGDPDYRIIPAAWGGFFRGSLDELRIYKAVLSPTQIQSIYDLEKPQ